ncbi:hypothetical protein HJC99_02745 [Candidatus Saccharibacteria bacterium]|nr:hypothetical protein [Candidatus Saccharibacteria bacterium]
MRQALGRLAGDASDDSVVGTRGLIEPAGHYSEPDFDPIFIDAIEVNPLFREDGAAVAGRDQLRIGAHRHRYAAGFGQF